ncbi:MAG: cofactor-independent phosphoglycerate mutase [Myxococcota bacterium]|jgi:2,3-bisphosphoglycerate-independent phosphoglycerate mutase|nr:cofactor-independent phosphoglycerate mutase [Myxococcota bacterium]
MKSIIIIGDGMSDLPVARLNGRTPLMAARKPNIDRIAKLGRTGLFQTIPEGMPLGSDVANMSVLGYDVREVYCGRAVIEAASMGIDLAPQDVGLRCNLIATQNGRIKNHSAGHISTEEGRALIEALEEKLGGGRGELPATFHAGVSYRHLLVLRGGWASPLVECAPPHDHVGEEISTLLPRASSSDEEAVASARRLVELYEKSRSILASHPINHERRAAGKDPADSIWTWSPGRRPTIATLRERFGKSGAVISAVDLIMGLGVYAGMEVLHVPGATGLWDTNYEGKAQAALDALRNHDMVYVHVEASDEASHAKDLDLKIRCIEMLDERLVGPILRGIEDRGIECIVSVLPDHPTPVETGAHSGEAVPVAILDPRSPADDIAHYDEQQCAAGNLGTLIGEEFIQLALGI